MSVSRRAVLGGIAASAVASVAWPAFARTTTLILRPKPDRELMVPVEGGSIYVRVNGDLNGPRAPFIGMHGGPGSGHSGLLPFTAMADERAVILYDQLDSGQSDAPMDPANWRVSRFVDELDHIRDALGIKRWHVQGGSWGGTLALEYGARQRPEMASVIISSPLVSTKRWTDDAAILRSQLPEEYRTMLDRCDTAAPPPKAECDVATRAYYARHVGIKGPLDEVAAYRASRPRRAPRDLYQRMWGDNEFTATGTLKDYDGEPLLKKLDAKRTLFVCGEFDEARPETVAAFAREVPGGARFEMIPGAAHGLTSDAPEAYIALVRSWCAAHDRGPS